MFKNMKLGGKIVATVVVILAVTIIIGLLGLSSLGTVGGYLERIATHNLPSLNSAKTLADAQKAITVGERGLLSRRMTATSELRQAQYKYIEDAWERANDAWKRFG